MGNWNNQFNNLISIKLDTKSSFEQRKIFEKEICNEKFIRNYCPSPSKERKFINKEYFRFFTDRAIIQDQFFFIGIFNNFFGFSDFNKMKDSAYSTIEKYYLELFSPFTKVNERDNIIEISFLKHSPISPKEIFTDIKDYERIKLITFILEHMGFLFEVFSLDDFYLNPLFGIFLYRYHHLHKFDEDKLKNILRCHKCHSSMELDLDHFKEKGLRTQEAYYSCPHCKTSSSYTKLLKTYETNKKNSYN